MVENVYPKKQKNGIKWFETCKILLFQGGFCNACLPKPAYVYTETWHFMPNATAGQCRNVDFRACLLPISCGEI